MHKHWTQVCFDFFKREHVLEIFVIDKFSPWKIITSIFFTVINILFKKFKSNSTHYIGPQMSL